jgi:imidazole glycerol-phosphate synthase subunit HisH
MTMITVVNYGVGNIQAFVQIYQNLNINVNVASTPEEIKRAKRIILPGVGAFDWAMKRLNESGLRDSLDLMVMDRHLPVLGVCVGMQMMAIRSEEGVLPGLGWVNANVTRFEIAHLDKKPLPHMGWNDVQPNDQNSLFRDIYSPRFYFLHTYCIETNVEENILSTTHYGNNFTSSINAANIFGTQFHPEKSHHWGVKLLHNFVKL